MDAARVKARLEGTSRLRMCDWCQKPYEEFWPRTIFELEQLRVVLFVTGAAATHDRPICDSCYHSVVASAPRRNNESSLDVGGSNTGPPNMLLRRAHDEAKRAEK